MWYAAWHFEYNCGGSQADGCGVELLYPKMLHPKPTPQEARHDYIQAAVRTKGCRQR